MKLESHHEKTFENETIVLDNKEFEECRFENCTLVYGGGHLQLVGNEIINCDIEFDDAAARSLHFLIAIGEQYEDPEAFLDNVRAIISQE
ncbi:hypothetical protein [Salinibacter altiplanensis]|uniref:hypothetical protein n=1 Tax=Salinibacter altiplanensis TaxID=1803181 RepID=UPI00131A4BEA|nr:hypothetical protein [Salinibacter altiplanensis]